MQQSQFGYYTSKQSTLHKSFGMQTVDQKISTLLTRLHKGNKREFILINNLVKNWDGIIGKKFSKFCYPKTIRFEKISDEKQKNKNPYGGVLTIAVYNAAVGTQLGWIQESIIERIACLYGHKSIRKIIIKQEPKAIQSTPTILLSEEEELFVQEGVAKIDNKELAEILINLGREVLNKSNR